MKDVKDEEKYKVYLRKLGLSDKKIGDMLGYSSRQSWHSAHRRSVIIKGLLQIFERCEEAFTKNTKD